jgi:DNA mismatch repair protein MutL
MKKVEVLPPEVINFIAAGEIIEKPASIVKELLENAIDAGATAITLKIQDNQGAMVIVVEDNGLGIDPDDLPKIFLQHATSKAQNIKEIIHIKTLGFRGEALWAMGNIGQVQCNTFFQGQSYGITCNHGTIGPVHHQGVTEKTGTTFIMENIFQNMPVRKKFLKDFSGEYQAILKIFLEEAFCHPSISFNHYLNYAMVHCFNGSSLIARLEDITKVAHWTINEQGEENNYKGILMASHKKKGKFFINLNGRPIEDYKIKIFIKNQMEKQDAVVGLTGGLCLTIPPEDVDVNIHPRKLEVRFKDSITLFNLIKKLVVLEGQLPPLDNGALSPGYRLPSYKYPSFFMDSPKKSTAQANQTHHQENFQPQRQNHWVSDHEEKNYRITHWDQEKFLMVKKDKQIIMVHMNPIENPGSKGFASKIITLKSSTLVHSSQWHCCGIKFSIVSENSIIVWEIPSTYPGSMENFFNDLEKAYGEGHLDWLSQFTQWNQETIIEYIENHEINQHWPLAHCSWIINLS